MKKIIVALAVALVAFTTNAQELPRPSPTGTVTQKVGVTDVTLEYSRPGAKNRKVFGELVPFDKLWRFGANSCTKITTTTSLYFGESELKAGTYSVFAIPGKDSWEIIFNTDTDQGGTEDYTKDKDALRVKATPKENSFTETYTLSIDNITDESASIAVLWEKTRVDIPFKVKTDELAKKNIDASIGGIDKIYNNAANYYYGSLKDYKKALEYVDKSVATKETYGNLFLKARVIYELGKKEEAVKLANKALGIAKAADAKGYVNFIEGTLTKWAK